MHSSLTIIGGGLAGLAAAEAACRSGMRVELLEARPTLGGRAGSFRDPQSGLTLDACQHLALGCCGELLDFLQRLGLADALPHHRRLHFLATDGRQCDFVPARWLPAPLHLLPGLLGLRFLTWTDRLKIAGAMVALARTGSSDPGETVAGWLARHGQSAAAVEGFWAPVLLSALGDTLEKIALSAARQVIVQGFLSSRQAYELCLPRMPLAELHERIGAALRAQGVAIRLKTRVRRIEGDCEAVREIRLADDTVLRPERVVLAVPWWQVPGLLGAELSHALPEVECLKQIRPAAITAVHLWFDRPITPLPHAVLLGRTAQWLFRPAWVSPERSGYCQVVISASHALAPWPRQELLNRVLDDLRATWPEVAVARLLCWQIVAQRAAVFSCVPGLDALRPRQHSSVSNLFWAGDWTATGWPATMEGAVRSGRLAIAAGA